MADSNALDVNNAPDPEAMALLENLEDLHTRIAAIRPGLIVQVQFGDRLKPGRRSIELEGLTKADFPNSFTKEGTFRDHFDKGPKFDNVFDKAGDGWIDVHGIDLDYGLDVVLPELTADLFRNIPE